MTPRLQPPNFWSWNTLVLLGIFFLGATALQRAAGAPRVDFSYFPDEPSHYVTGLMIYDYLRESPLPSPVDFARQYYLRYPKVALGQWPPAFYAVESIWMKLFGIEPASVLALLALFTAANAVLVFWFAARMADTITGLASAIVFLLLTLVQELNASVMVDIAMTTAILTATAMCGSLIQERTLRRSWQFGVMSAVVILMKANALLLAMVPAVAALLCRQLWSLARMPVMWLPLPLVVAGVLPWYLTVSRIVSKTISGDPGWAFTRLAIERYSSGTFTTFGLPVLALICIGLWVGLVEPIRRRTLTPAAAVLPAMGISCVIFHCLVPNGPDFRYMLPTLAWLCVAASTGSLWLARKLPVSATRQSLAAAAVLLALFLSTAFHVHHKPDTGLRKLVETLHRQIPPDAPVTLVVSGQPSIEGALIAEIARIDRRGQWFVHRGSKIAASSAWTGRAYRLTLNSPSELKAQLDRVPIHYLLIEQGSWSAPHHELFKSLRRQMDSQWKLVLTAPGLEILQTHPVGGCVHPLPVNMTYTLGGSIAPEVEICRPRRPNP